MLKKSISLVLLLSIILTGCANKSTIDSSTSIIDETKQVSVNSEGSIKNEAPGVTGRTIKPLNSKALNDRELKIAGKPLLQLKYLDLIKLWGKPNEIIKEKVYFPAVETSFFSYILKYDGIEIQMYPVENNTAIKNTESFIFDITSSKYDFYGIRVGTSLDDYLKTVENKDVFSIKEIFEDTSGERVPFEYRKLLTLGKKNNCYDGYEKAAYEQFVINETPHGAVLLFKDDKISRIVFGWPNAS